MDGGKSAEADHYIDLGEMVFEDELGAVTGAKSLIKVAEVLKYEDINGLTSHLYNGNILVIDYTAIGSDELALKRITADLKTVATDINGDVAAIGKNYIIATPQGVKIDRTKIKGPY
ncbi:MAG: cell division protein SepF [Thermoplasmata archaeon]|nr:cell division protein SepF [Thermoplasmata archaeon]